MKNLLIITLAILFFTSCKKKDNTYYISKETKRNLSFMSGSYWIFRDSISGKEDSFISTNGTYIVNRGREDDNPIHEVFLTGLKQMSKDSAIKEENSWGMIVEEDIAQTYFRKIINGEVIANPTIFQCS